ncbi:50S ribosomal protein L11 methyltransferase [Qipengyuania atrilutea]|uniref:Ribosomal protein L11 methyltransferase n=1 Tax=Qipengyuania atrilutea TaxID=2744473 RepID=A0A850GWN9_9SPHN|nr:50S ribosomal protein L11 methyltransferase [Actirhodobacter atriluteus]NVD43961.1 50S ribosomal protein L11 methyltransferase [Actirhodobacter atriluteus]
MPSSWKISGLAPKRAVQAALLEQDEREDWDGEIVLVGREIAENRPQEWVLEAFLPRSPTDDDEDAIRSLFEGGAPAFVTEELADEDWLTMSQNGAQPITAGRFYVHTPDHPARGDASLIDLVIPASQAFGTGQHETTAGCLEMLTAMRASGVRVRAIADIGTGTGLLAFGARTLWPSATITASDIDAVCLDVIEHNALLNDVPLGSGRGKLTMLVADGMDHPLLEMRGPYDLLIANILAGPLVELARDFADHVPPGGNVVLAGLLETQERAVRQAYRRAGFRLAKRLVNGDWSILWLRKRR